MVAKETMGETNMKALHKIKTKNLAYAHITPSGQVIAYYRKRDKESGKDIEWHEHATEDGAIKIYNAQKQSVTMEFRSLYVERSVAKLLPYVQYFDVYPVANEYALRNLGTDNSKPFSEIDLRQAKAQIAIRLSIEETLPLCSSCVSLVGLEIEHRAD